MPGRKRPKREEKTIKGEREERRENPPPTSVTLGLFLKFGLRCLLF